MKTLVRQVGLLAALAVATPLFTMAQAGFGSRPARQDVERLTLLPGPYLLSPARTTPTMAPSPLKLGVQPAVYSAPTVGAASTTTAIAETDAKRLPHEKAAPPSPESLRFEWKLNPPPAPGEMKFVPAAKAR